MRGFFKCNLKECDKKLSLFLYFYIFPNIFNLHSIQILDSLQCEGASADVIAELNSSLLALTVLYEKFAEPWALWECKLAIVHCAGHSEPQLVQVRLNYLCFIVSINCYVLFLNALTGHC